MAVKSREWSMAPLVLGAAATGVLELQGVVVAAPMWVNGDGRTCCRVHRYRGVSKDLLLMRPAEGIFMLLFPVAAPLGLCIFREDSWPLLL